MINELIILLSDKQQAELIRKAKEANMDDDLAYLQLHLNEWLGIRPSAETKLKKEEEGMAEALAQKMGDFDRWFNPCEKCGYDAGRVGEKSEAKCWKCGSRLTRDYSERALKK